MEATVGKVSGKCAGVVVVTLLVVIVVLNCGY